MSAATSRSRSKSGDGTDVFGHGTAVTDIIRQIAREAEIGTFRVLGERLNSRTVVIREGVRQAIDRGYHILNCSFGCGVREHILQYKDWIDEAYPKGIHIVAACNNIDFTVPRQCSGDRRQEKITSKQKIPYFNRRGTLRSINSAEWLHGDP